MLHEQQFQEAIFGSIAEDLWIKRRLELGPVIQKLESLASDIKEEQELRDRASDWLSFVQFLGSDCSGALFTDDKPWSELMNLMGISRRFNQRSVKVAELLRNKRTIEANARQIRRLNESIRLAQSVERSLDELELLVEQCRLELDTEGEARMNERIADCEHYLQARCRPLLYGIKLELNSEDLVSRPILETKLNEWRSRARNCERRLECLREFLKNLRHLQESLARLGPLVESVQGSRAATTEKAATNEQLLQTRLIECRETFKRTRSFYQDQLLKKLRSDTQESTKRTRDKSHRINRQPHKQAVALASVVLAQSPKAAGQSSNGFRSSVFELKLKMALDEALGCERCLSELMQALRLEFGRFYFVNDLELLTIIALDSRLVEQRSSRNQRLLLKLFSNSICSFQLDETQTHLVGVVSPTGEELALVGAEPVPLRKRVNIYSLEIVRILNELLRKLKRSLRFALCGAMLKLAPIEQAPRVCDDMVWALPLQLMLVVDQVRFTQRVEHALDAGHLDALIEIYRERFSSLSLEDAELRSEGAAALKRSAALSMSVHFLSTLVRLRELGVSSALDWNWLKLARHYFCREQAAATDDGWQIEVRIASAKFNYNFHYLPIELVTGGGELDSSGSAAPRFKRLISSATSERCLAAAGLALAKFRLGASPYGPAGGGKTETIKALGQLVGSQVVVHNCDQSNDRLALERLVWGLAHTGLWGCFDEFNRLSAGTLSALSATLELLQSSLRSRQSSIQLKDGQIKTLDPQSAFFITLNPADKARKYRGRCRLPSNLRALFLPVSMACVQVDTIVSELLLVSMSRARQRYTDLLETTRRLGCKLAEWLETMREKQEQFPTCAWDLRLVMAILKRVQMVAESEEPQEAGLENLLLQAVRQELRPRLENEQQSNVLETSLVEAFATQTNRAIPDELASTESKQVAEQLLTRSGVILLGPSGAGKTRAWQKATLESQIDWFACNPNAYEKGQLFGRFEDGCEPSGPSSCRWRDGILTKLVRDSLQLLSSSDGQRKQQVWIVLDGSIDPDWIECLNSVLDDNQVLTLGSGERISFVVAPTKCVKLVFETTHIENASPASISRLGLVSFGGRRPIDKTSGDRLSLRIAVGGLCHLSRRKWIIENYLKKEHTEHRECLIEYDCFAGADSKHLVQILDSCTENCCFVFHNLHLITPKDEFGARCFVELLRFALSYSFYYDENHRKCAIPKSVSFIISIDSMKFLDEDGGRLKALASEVEEIAQSQIRDEPFQTINRIESLMDSARVQGISVISVVCESLEAMQSCESKLEQNLASLESGAQILRFSNSIQARQSLEDLTKLSLEPFDCHTSAQGRQYILMLDEIELAFMRPQSVKDLLHALNLILRSTKLMRVFYFCAEQLKAHHHLALTSMSQRSGDSYKLLICETEVASNSILGKLDFDDQSDWLEEKLSKLVGKTECEKSFSKCLKKIVERARENVEAKVRHLSSALDNLAKFELRIEQTKAKREAEEQELAYQRKQIESMLEHIEMQLNNSNEQQRQVKQFSSLLEEKSDEISSQSAKIEKRLSGVVQLVELSKREVSSCLRVELLNEIKSLRQPPKAIKDVLDVLMVLLSDNANERGVNWPEIRSFLASISLKEELNNYDFERRLTAEALARLERALASKGAAFSREQAARASSAIVPVVNWIEAARQFGRVLAEMKPLSESKRQLEDEKRQIERSMGELRDKQREIDAKIEFDRVNVAELERKFARAKEESQRVKLELERAKEARANLSQQVDRWQSSLRLFKILGTPRKQLRFCLLACHLLLEYQASENELEPILELLEFERESIELEGRPAIWANVLNLLGSDDETPEENLAKFSGVRDERHEARLLELLVLRLNLALAKHSELLALWLRPDSSGSSHDELTDELATRQIVCESSRALATVKVMQDEPGQWQQAADFAWSTRKLVLLDMRDVHDSFADVWLDVLGFCRSRARRQDVGLQSPVILCTRATVFEHSQSAAAAKLLGLRMLWTTDEAPASLELSNAERTNSRLAEIFLQLRESSLAETVHSLELDLRARHKSRRRLEAQLIERLSCGSDDQSLVTALSEAQECGAMLEAKIGEARDQLAALERRLAGHAHRARRGAALYADLFGGGRAHVSPVFGPFSLAEFARQVLDSSDEAGPNVESILLSAMRPLARCARQKFCKEVSAKVDAVVAARAAHRAADLKRGLLDLIEDLRAPGEQAEASFRLALVLHGAEKSSPQAEVDETLGRLADEGSRYEKLYACDEDDADSQRAIVRCVADALGARPVPGQNRVEISCICVANAHLASARLAAELLQTLRKSRTCSTSPVLLVFVAESEEDKAPAFLDCAASELLECAHLKQWHDELALKPSERFEMLKAQLGREPIHAGHSELVTELTDSLIRFHIACQEANGAAGDAAPSMRFAEHYTFDSDQLFLALRVLDQLAAEHRSEPSLRATFCNHLKSIVYGARMDRRQDELALSELVEELVMSGRAIA